MEERLRKFASWMVPLVLLAVLCAPGVSAQSSSSDDPRGPAGDAQHLLYVQVNGVKLAYRVEGSGFPVIFVHGEGYSHELWTRQIEDFKKHYLFISYDRRGHGQSEAPFTGYNPIAHAEDLNALANFLGIREAHFVVNSRGGAVIQQFLRLHPEKVRSVIFADATISLAGLSETFRNVTDKNLEGPPSLEQALERRAGAARSSFTRVAQADPEVRAILERMVNQYSTRNYRNPQRSDITSPMDIGPWNSYDHPDMSKLSMPILLVVGELTDSFFIEGAKEAHRLWPNTQYEMIPGADHLLALEKPEIFNRLALDFLQKVDAQVEARKKWVQVP